MVLSSQAISPSDVEEAFRIFDEDGVPRANIRFYYHAASDCWCLRNSDGDVLVASRGAPPNAIEWSRV